jgi:hypothetical protein
MFLNDIRLNSRTLIESIRIWSRKRDEFETLIKSIALNQYSFFVVVFYRLLICAFTDQCWYLYDDDTNQVSILYECSLLIEWDTRFWLIASDDLYVESVNHVTHANSIWSGYLSTSLSKLIKPFVRTRSFALFRLIIIKIIMKLFLKITSWNYW